MSHFRIHPSIAFARVGNSTDYYLAPETEAGSPMPNTSGPLTGGLPIRAGTEKTTITSTDLRDGDGCLKRQAARFRIFCYDDATGDAASLAHYPVGGGREICIGSTVGNRTVQSILWTVHLANKKANWYQTDPAADSNLPIISLYADGQTPPLRNPADGPLAGAQRLKDLVIDPGPRTVAGRGQAAVNFDAVTEASYYAGTARCELPGYPQQFPQRGETGQLTTLGALKTDDEGRLLVIPAPGLAKSWNESRLDDDVDNNGWMDDTADGPVNACLLFDDGTSAEVCAGWVICTDPGYAPQILNSVPLFDDIYDTFVRSLGLRPDVYNDKGFVPSYSPTFDDEVKPFFAAAGLQEWIANLPEGARHAHRMIAEIGYDDPSEKTLMAGLAYVRNPNLPNAGEIGAPMMPLSLGDSGSAFMSTSPTQYFFLQQWDVNRKKEGRQALGAGEYLDRASLMNCLGGRFSPGIDMTFIVRQPDLYADWKAVGPFRINAKPMNYAAACAGQSFLGVGYVPLRTVDNLIEPGDVSKFMALPWHTDYNSCATHPTSPNRYNNRTLYWSWPAQRPVNVFVAAEVKNGVLGPQRYSVRGEGTYSSDPADQGRYQEREDILRNWPNIGIVMQSPAIDELGKQTVPEGYYLEVKGQLTPEARADAPVAPWPMLAATEADLQD